MLDLKDFRGLHQVEHLLPNQIRAPIEICDYTNNPVLSVIAAFQNGGWEWLHCEYVMNRILPSL